MTRLDIEARTALRDFASATRRLNAVLPCGEFAGYPESLPSFDEFTFEVSQWLDTTKHEETMHALQTGERVLVTQGKMVMRHNIGVGEYGTVCEVFPGDNAIGIRLDRRFPDLDDWGNCLNWSFDDFDETETGLWGDQPRDAVTVSQILVHNRHVVRMRDRVQDPSRLPIF